MAKKKQQVPAFRRGGKIKRNITKLTWHDVKGQCFFLFFLTTLLCSMILTSSYKQYKKNEVIRNEITEITLQIKKEEAKTLEFENLKKYMQTNLYIEQEARTKLGLVKDGEIVFISKDED